MSKMKISECEERKRQKNIPNDTQETITFVYMPDFSQTMTSL